MIIIYLITNSINNKKYVGQTATSLQTRWTRHCWPSERSKKMAISIAIYELGQKNFKIEQIDVAENRREAHEKEVYWGIYHNVLTPNGYNNRLGGESCAATSESVKAKISKINLGRKASPETIKKLSESHRGFKVSEETKRKLSLANKGKFIPPHVREAARQGCIKNYKVVSPNGEIIEIRNMKDFCEKNNLLRSSMCSVCKGNQTHHKGWTKFKDI